MKFRVILIDPPWKYADNRNHKSAGMARSAYPVMSIEELCSLKIAELADKDSMLCLWATGPKLPEAFQVMKAWGFEYTSVLFSWLKMVPTWDSSWKGVIYPAQVYSGLGHYTNSNQEYVLGGRKGKFWREARDVKQVVIAPRGAHSVKPLEVKRRIERLFGDVNRLEIFARTSEPGWTSIGNGISGLDIREEIETLIHESRD